MNYRMISYIIGCIWLFEAAFLLVPVVTALVYGEQAVFSFLWTILICLAAGALLSFKKPKNQTLRARDGLVVVSLSWIALSLLGALPFMFTGVTASYVDALFETVSGFTTTGATIFPAVEDLPRSILMWRSFTHWIGGMGVLVFIMAFVPLSGGRNMHIMKAESPGPDVSKLVPRVKQTAMILYALYISLTLIQLVFLLFGGMSFFEAINTALATAGTGGFSIKNDSLASYSSYIQIVVTVFMFLFALNFNSYYLALKLRFKDAFNTEIKVFIAIVVIVTAIVAFDIRNLFDSTGLAIKNAAFTVVSIISSTGFTCCDFNIWPELSRTLIVLIMFVGACAGSTGGGIKVSRILILFKGMRRELNQMSHPKQVKKISMDGKPIDDTVVRSALGYLVAFVMLFAVSVLAISIDNYDFTTNFTAVAATMGNIGPGLNAVGPTCNFAFFSIPSKLVLSFDMLAGRLELIPMLVLFSPKTWKK